MTTRQNRIGSSRRVSVLGVTFRSGTLSKPVLIVLLGGGVLLVVLAVLVGSRFSSPVTVPLPESVSPDEFQRESAALERRYQSPPAREDVLFELGRRAAERGDWKVADDCFRVVPIDHRRCGQAAAYLHGQVLLQQRRLSEAEPRLVEFLAAVDHQQQPLVSPADAAAARKSLSYLLALELRFEERAELLRTMVAHGEAGPFDLVARYFPSLLQWNGAHGVEQIEAALKHDPHNFALRVALGRYRTGGGQLDEAAEILLKCYEERPNNLNAVAAVIECHLERGAWSEAQRLIEATGPTNDHEPWLMLRLRGRLLQHASEFAAAAVAFERAIAADPSSTESYAALADCCRNLSDTKCRDAALHTLQGLARIQSRLGHIAQQPDDMQPLIEVAEICETIGWKAAALALANVVRQSLPNEARLVELLQKLEATEGRVE